LADYLSNRGSDQSELTMISPNSQLDFGPHQCRFMFGNSAADGVLREWLEGDVRAARLSTAFRAYYLIRSLLPLPIRQCLQRYRRVDSRPGWYFPDACAGELADGISECGGYVHAIHPWPDGAEMACVLTHDVETAGGMRRIGQIASLEEGLGFRSSWNIVPCKYPVDRGLLHDLSQRGFEIGVHGYNHDGKLFSSRAIFDRRVPAINSALEEFSAVGFRAPMVHRNLGWLQALDIDYDASCFDIDPFQAMPGGVGGVWPFIAGRFVELPYTLPQDHTLLIALSERSGRIWTEKLAYLAKLCGMALLITHPDYLDCPRAVDIYRRFLNEVREMEGVWRALPRDVASWWRQRDASSLRREPNGIWSVRGPAENHARAVQIRVNGDATNRQFHYSPFNDTMADLLASTIEWSHLAAEGEMSAQTVNGS
jgi:hypothetical protein